MIDFSELRKMKEERVRKAYADAGDAFPEIEFDESDMAMCSEFADRYDYSAASSRHSRGSSSKFRSDNMAGKLGEIVVRKTLDSLGIKMGEPDFTILDNRDKSFASDIVSDRGDRFSVKSFYNYDFPISWTLQYRNADGFGGTDMHFFGDDDSLRQNEWFCGVAISPDRKKGRILWLAPMQIVHDNGGVLYELPIKKELQKTKRVIYWDTVMKNGLDGCNMTSLEMLAE